MAGRIVMRLMLLVATLTLRIAAHAQTEPLERNLWYNEKKTAKIQIFKATDGKYYGRIVWLKIPEVDGHPKVDIHNPDETKRSNPIMGLTFLKGLRRENDALFQDGTIYDPETGKTYSCKLTYKGDKLDLRGYMGFSLIGKTTTWTKAD